MNGLDLKLSDEALRVLHGRLTQDGANKVKLLMILCAHFAAAKGAAAKAEVVRKALESEVFKPVWDGISVPSLYRKCQAWAESGSVMALADKRELRGKSACGLAANGEFVAYWQSLCCENKRKTAPARRKLFAVLASGAAIPGMGDWRAIYTREYGVQPAEGAPCPYRINVQEPKGWSVRNLKLIGPGKYALAASRHGMMAAQMDFGAIVKRTRRELVPCQVVQMDDMWYEHKVAFAGNRHAQRVVEYAMLDVLTGHVISYLTKPVREREDGTKETLRSKWTRYLVAHLLCTVGIPENRHCLIMGEHGTASADSDLKAVLAEISGGHVEYDALGHVKQIVDGTIRFGAGGLLSTPLGRGLYDGRPKGNPRYKGLLEGLHGLIKNELGDVRGHVGGGRGLEPETVYGMDKRDEQLRILVKGLELARPGIMDRLQLPYIPYYDFLELVRQAYDRLDRRIEHQLEGWEECGFVVGEWRPTEESPWVPWAPAKLSPEKLRAFKYLIDAGEIPFRTRRMSPGEAWAARKGELKVLDPVVATLVMGRELSRLCAVSDRLQMVYKDEETLAKCSVCAMLDDGRTLERGAFYNVWVNPLSPFKAYVADAAGRFLGTARVLEAARYDDAKALERQLGIRQAVLASERAKMQPVVTRMLRAENARAAANVRAVTGVDPVRVAAEREAAAIESRAGAMRIRLDDADFLPDVDAAAEKPFAIADDDLLD